MKRTSKPLSLGLVALVCFFLGNGFAHADTIYVANSGNNTIEEFDSSGTGSVFANSGLNHPHGLAFDSSGNLYVANYLGNTIEKFDSSGTGSVFASGLNWPRGLAFDSSGNLYVANSGEHTIEEFDSSGTGSVFHNFTSSLHPQCLAFESSGNLYVSMNRVAGGNPEIKKIDLIGNESVFASSGLNDPWGIAVQVPEPATWGLLALGASALLGGLRLRRRSS
ncbi:MAG: NHL repeat-containing protein [Verrucomicrobiia bacterium]